MIDSRPIMEQFNELLHILGQFTQHEMYMDESISAVAYGLGVYTVAGTVNPRLLGVNRVLDYTGRNLWWPGRSLRRGSDQLTEKFSERSSPLNFDPEIERIARRNRVLHRTELASPIVQQPSTMEYLNNNPPPEQPIFDDLENLQGNPNPNQPPHAQPIAQPQNQFHHIPHPNHPPNDDHHSNTTEERNTFMGGTHYGTIGSDENRINDWDDSLNGDDYNLQNVNAAYEDPYGYPQPPPQMHNTYPPNPQPLNQGGYGFHQQPQYGYPPPQGFNRPPRHQNQNYGPGIPMPPPNMGVPMNYNQGMTHAQGATTHFRPALTTNSSPVVTPVRHGRSFEVRPAVLSSLPTFHGRATEEPYQHLQEFEQFCQVKGGQGFSADEVKLILFPFSLKDRAKEWFSTLPEASIYTWAEMQQQFLSEFYTMKKTTEARAAIRNFKQKGGELFHEAFTRFKDMLRKCPHHGINMWELLVAFYDGMSSEDIRDINSQSNGTFLYNHVQVDWDMLERMSATSKRLEQSNKRSKHESVNGASAQLSEEQLEVMAQKVAKIAGLGKGNTTSEKVFSVCGGCGELGHKASQSFVQFGPTEEVNQVYGDINSNTNHPGLRNHPNFRYGNTANQMNPNFQVPNNQGGYQKPYQGNQKQGSQNNYRNQSPQQGGPTSNFEASKLDDIFEMLNEMKKENEMRDKAFNALNKQVGQMAEELARRNHETLPSNTQANPAHQGSGSKNLHVNAALLDLGACVSILPGSVYDQYDFDPLKKVDTTVVLVNHTSTLSRGMLSDVIVKVGNFYYPVDILVLDFAESAKDTHPTVILGRPFLATAHAMIDCANGTVGLRFGGREKQINMFEIATNPLVKNECSKANIVDKCDFLSKEDNTKEECFMLHRSKVAKAEQPKEDKDAENKKASKDDGWIPKWRRIKNEKKAKSLGFDEKQVRLKMFGPNWETWEDLTESRKLDFVGYAEVPATIIAGNKCGEDLWRFKVAMTSITIYNTRATRPVYGTNMTLNLDLQIGKVFGGVVLRKCIVFKKAVAYGLGVYTVAGTVNPRLLGVNRVLDYTGRNLWWPGRSLRRGSDQLTENIIDKLPPLWKDFKHTLKHRKDDLNLVQLGSALRIEESLRSQETDKGKGKIEENKSSVNMVETDNKFKRFHKGKKGKRKFKGNDHGSNKKGKMVCWNYGKPGHLKRDCRVKMKGTVGIKTATNGVGPSGSKDPSGQNGMVVESGSFDNFFAKSDSLLNHYNDFNKSQITAPNFNTSVDFGSK
ncbi:hypothetical protein E3N88_11249 [Mikania micrantha]|uniref:CCHC-type domain-containing protein n=1 Tax=Mikania micrantha TaxID=192012 RepID=A0A5N6PDY8_9ASTR|nr:hypothetical protein E3N88_11249 [Mikania micrantha]